jgi:hypothetical protein
MGRHFGAGFRFADGVIDEAAMPRCMSPELAQMRSADRIELRLSLEAKRKTSTRDEYFAF